MNQSKIDRLMEEQTKAEQSYLNTSENLYTALLFKLAEVLTNLKKCKVGNSHYTKLVDKTLAEMEAIGK